jgi:hypothetical protein
VNWDSTELEQVATTTELRFASRRPDETLSRYTFVWVVRVGTSLYVRSAYGPDTAWYRRALRYGRGRIRAGGLERDVVLDHLAPDDHLHGDIDTAYHAKYDQYGRRLVATVVGPDVTTVTLRLDPAPSPPSA